MYSHIRRDGVPITEMFHEYVGWITGVMIVPRSFDLVRLLIN